MKSGTLAMLNSHRMDGQTVGEFGFRQGAHAITDDAHLASHGERIPCGLARLGDDVYSSFPNSKSGNSCCRVRLPSSVTLVEETYRRFKFLRT